MTFLSTLIDSVQEWLEDEADEEQVIHAIMRSIREVETAKDWEALKDTATVTPDSNGVIMEPPQCRVIRRVYPAGYDGLPDFRFMPKSEIDQYDQPRSKQYKMISYKGIEAQLSDGLLLDITQNSQTLTQAAASTDDIETAWVGERLRVEGDETLYEILAANAATDLTVTPDIRRTTRDAAVAKVRPIGLQRYQLSHSNGTLYTTDVEVHFQKRHPQLISYSDMLMIPAERMVTLGAVKFFLHQTKYDVDARELLKEYNDAKRVETQQEGTAVAEAVGPRKTFATRSRRNNSNLR
jgi:hypothetical protein